MLRRRPHEEDPTRRRVAEEEKKGVIGLYQPGVLRLPLRRALRAAGLPMITVHGLRRTFNNLAHQVTSGEVVRAITGHMTVAMTEHYSHIAAIEKQAAAAKIMRLLSVGGGSHKGGSDGSEKLE
jgi:integrase